MRQRREAGEAAGAQAFEDSESDERDEDERNTRPWGPSGDAEWSLLSDRAGLCSFVFYSGSRRQHAKLLSFRQQ